MSRIRHAGLIALHGAGGWRGVLIEGASGVGKSDLALRALQVGFRLVADDRTIVWSCQGRLFGACPPAIGGLIEARGVGITRSPDRSFSEIHLIVNCVGVSERVERLPEFASQAIMGVPVPALSLHALEAASPMKLIHALSLLGPGR